MLDSFPASFGGHPFPIDDQPLECHIAGHCFILRHQAWGTRGQVQVAAMGGSQERMASVIVQQQEGATAQDFAGAPNHSTRDEASAVHGFSVPIQEEDGHRWFAVLCGWFPQACRPGCQRIGQRFSTARLRHLRKKPFHVPIAEGAFPPGEERQPRAGIPTGIPRAPQPDSPQEEQREQQPTTARLGTVCQARGRPRLTYWHRLLQHLKQSCLVGGRQQQTSRSLLPGRLRRRRGCPFSPALWG